MNTTHPIHTAFLESQGAEARGLRSDVARLVPIGPAPHRYYVAEFRCTSVIRAPDGHIGPASGVYRAGIHFPDDYLRRAHAAQVVSWMEPLNIFHPNIAPPFVCIGRLVPGTKLIDLLFQIYEVVTFFKVTPREDDALNKSACAWARANKRLFPVDRTPLRRPVRLAAQPHPPA
jgi:hypothetical protein